MVRRIAVLGSTGSIGTQTLDVVRRHPDKLSVVALAAGRRVAQAIDQAAEFGVRYVALGADPDGVDIPAGMDVAVGAQAVADLVKLPEVDVVVNALVGAAGLQASYETLAAGKVLALANKESLVVGGDLIMPLAAQVDAARRAAGLAPAHGPAGALMPIDSEHGAIYQCLIGEEAREVERLWVTASGGPFRGRTREELRTITAEQALAHPTWNMGPKITIDSSTLMNKGLEIIEAHHLFNMPYDRISVVVQPQSAIHSMVEFSDGSVKAHLGTTDMRIPIQYALSYPDRWDAPSEPLDFLSEGPLSFAAPDFDTFRCLGLAYEAGRIGGTMPCVLNAANEVANKAFRDGRCSLAAIDEVVGAVMNEMVAEPVESLAQLTDVDRRSRALAREFLETIGQR